MSSIDGGHDATRRDELAMAGARGDHACSSLDRYATATSASRDEGNHSCSVCQCVPSFDTVSIVSYRILTALHSLLEPLTRARNVEIAGTVLGSS